MKENIVNSNPTEGSLESPLSDNFGYFTALRYDNETTAYYSNLSDDLTDFAKENQDFGQSGRR